MNLDEFYARYNNRGVGRKAYDPGVMLCLLLYAHSYGIRSSRKIEKLCRRDVSFRVITGNKMPDHATICRLRRENADLMESIFMDTLSICLEAGMIDPCAIAIDGTKIEANASMDKNRDMDERLRETVRGWMEEAERIDEEEDDLYGEDENPMGRMPERLADSKTREKIIEEYFERQREPAEAERKQQEVLERRKAEEKRTGKKKDGPRSKSPKEVHDRVEDRKKKINTTDPQSRVMKGRKGHLQGYNAQIATTIDQFIMAAHVCKESSDSQLLHLMINKAKDILEQLSREKRIEEAVADTGYMSEDNVIRENITDDARIRENGGPRLYINPKKDRKMAVELKNTPVEKGVFHDEDELNGIEKMEMRYKSERGRELFGIRGTTVEPVFGQIKENRECRRFMMRGIDLCRAEFLLVCTVHNLMKLRTKLRAKDMETMKMELATA